MTSLSAYGQVVDSWFDIEDKIHRILTTPLGTRVFRRDFGSDVPRLVDAPMNHQNLMRLQLAVVLALEPRQVRGFWYGEPRIRVDRVEVQGGQGTGRISLLVHVVRTDLNQGEARAVHVGLP